MNPLMPDYEQDFELESLREAERSLPRESQWVYETTADGFVLDQDGQVVVWSGPSRRIDPLG